MERNHPHVQPTSILQSPIVTPKDSEIVQARPAKLIQPEFFSLEQVQGYSSLSRRERLFALAIMEGCSQAKAARRAGVTGVDSYIRKVGTMLARKPAVRAVLNQAWAISGANLDASLRRTAAVAQRGFSEWENGETASERAAARAEWREAESLLASIHSKIGVKVEGDVNHHHSGTVGHLPLPASALPILAQMHRDTLIQATPVDGTAQES